MNTPAKLFSKNHAKANKAIFAELPKVVAVDSSLKEGTPNPLTSAPQNTTVETPVNTPATAIPKTSAHTSVTAAATVHTPADTDPAKTASEAPNTQQAAEKPSQKAYENISKNPPETIVEIPKPLSSFLSVPTQSSRKDAPKSPSGPSGTRFLWLKIASAAVFLLVAFGLFIFTSPQTTGPSVVADVAPMLKHVRATERDLKGRQLVALTFDDGPSRDTTPALLDILKDKDVPATFFMLGNLARVSPDIVLRAEREGHEIASHTMYHQNLVKISASNVRSDLAEATAVFKDILGHGPSALRPPYGNYNDAVKTSAGVPLILWSVDTLDWKDRNTESIVNLAMDQISEGGIILMHDVHPTSVEAVPTLVDTLREAGYEFVTISDLATMHGQKLTPGAAYYSIKP